MDLRENETLEKGKQGVLLWVIIAWNNPSSARKALNYTCPGKIQ